MFTTSPPLFISMSCGMRDTGAGGRTSPPPRSATENRSECAHNGTSERGTWCDVPRSSYISLKSRWNITFKLLILLLDAKPFFKKKAMDKNLTENSDMFSRPEYACTLLLHFRIPRLGTLALPWRESGRTISSDGERACGRVECGGPKCSSPYPQVFQFRPSSIEQRVPFISLISFLAVKSGLDSPPPFFPFLIPGAFSVRQSLPLSVSPSPTAFASFRRHASSMRCPSPL